tara:strand:- start:199 stop:810 length:612 start_codon:yes stop_codon:yes gene_type:complete
MRINSHLYKRFFSPSKSDKNIFVQLGPGKTNYLKGWVNVDSNIISGKLDVWCDLRYGIPFKKSTVDAFYSHHVIEHLPNINYHFKEVYGCLKKGGIYRFGGPHGDNAIKKFIANDYSWFHDFPDKRKSIGGKFENFIFCRGEHLTILTFSMLEEMLSEVGFKEIKLMLPVKESSRFNIFKKCLEIEYEGDFQSPHTIIIEASK